MNTKNLTFGTLLLASVFFCACGKDNDNEPGGGKTGGDKTVVVDDDKMLNQEVFADDTQKANGLSFTTTGAWTSSISTVPPAAAPQSVRPQAETASDSDNWLSISPDHGDKAGDYDLSLIFEPNLTGADRTAIITIHCEGKDITIKITQKAVTGENKVLTTKDLLIKHSWRHIKTIAQYPKSWDFPYTEEDESVRVDESTYIITFKEDGTATIGGGSIPYTISGNTLTLNTGGEGGVDFVVYQIINIGENFVDLRGTFEGKTCSDSPEGESQCSPYTYTETMTFMKN